MAKHAGKAHEALARRRIAFDNIPVQYRSNGAMRRPGSQNRKKGYAVNVRRR